ncbi:MAG: hypothetical protein MJZ09_02720 [Bacteroidales bacterium]|nr:hypothetical protein [Bacteroidales bacterium]
MKKYNLLLVKMTGLRNIRLNEDSVIIPMRMADLQQLMQECVKTTIASYKKELKEKEEQRYYTAKEVGEMFNKHISTINRWKHAGYLHGHPIGGKDYYDIEEVQNLLMKS